MQRLLLSDAERRDWLVLEQGCEAFAVPGLPLDPRYTGTHDLIRQGTVLTEKAADVLTHIRSLPTGMAEPPSP